MDENPGARAVLGRHRGFRRFDGVHFPLNPLVLQRPLVSLRPWWIVGFCVVSALSGPAPLRAATPDDPADHPSAEALLRGVEWARTKHDSCRISFEIRALSPPPAVTVEYVIEMVGAKRRSEILPGEVARVVVIRDSDVFYSYERGNHEDVHIFDLKEEVGGRGDVVFDPRILGLTDVMSADMTVNKCLRPVKVDKLELAGKDVVNKVPVVLVKASRNDGTTFEYAVEDGTFRVHRQRIRSPYSEIDVDSEFDPADEKTPFPRRVVARRRDKGRDAPFERTYTVKSLEFDPVIPPERFTLKSMDLPVNTAVVDYRIKRRVGFWNGEGLSESPVYPKERPVETSAPESRGGGRFIFIAVNVLVAIVFLVLGWWRWKGRPPSN